MKRVQPRTGTEPPRTSPGLSHATRRNLAVVRRIEQQLRGERSAGDIAVDFITAQCGSLPFIWLHVGWYGGWILINTLGPAQLRFDPYPFNLLTLVVSLEAIFLSSFILITQNRQARMVDLRSNLDLQINLLGEEESTKTLAMLQAIHQRLGISVDDAELEEMEQQLEPELLARQIEQIMDGPDEAPGM